MLRFYSTYDDAVSTRIEHLANANVTETYSITSFRHMSSIRMCDIYTPDNFDPTQRYRLVFMCTGLNGNSRGEVKDWVFECIKENSITDMIVVGLYGKPITPYVKEEDIEGDLSAAGVNANYPGYEGTLETSMTFNSLAICDSHDPFEEYNTTIKLSQDIDYIQFLIARVRKMIKLKEIIYVGKSNGSAIGQHLIARNRRRINTFIGNSAQALTSLVYDHTEPVNFLEMHSTEDSQAPFTGGAGNSNYVFKDCFQNYVDWVEYHGETAILTQDIPGFGFTPTSELVEYTTDTGTKIIKLLKAVSDNAGGAHNIVHGLGALATVDDTYTGLTTTEILNGLYWYDFINIYPTEKLF